MEYKLDDWVTDKVKIIQAVTGESAEEIIERSLERTLAEME